MEEERNMSIGLSFIGKIDSPQALLEAAKILAAEQNYCLTAGESGLKVVLCPLGGEVNILWRPEGDPAGPWLVRGDCVSTPAGAGLHRAAVELLDNLPIHALTVEDETGFCRHRDFHRMKEEHFYPWLKTLVDVCRQECGKGASGMQLCWDLEQYAPQDIPDTVVTPVGRFLLSELVDLLEKEGVEALASRFFLWNGRIRDAKFYRNRAINALWEQCCFAPSARSWEDEAVNAAILDDLERAAKLDPSLPLPRAAYEEVCALARREPALPQGPCLAEAFSPGYRKGLVTHSLGALRLTLPGSFQCGWEQWEKGGGAYLWTDGSGPVWRVSPYRMRDGDARFTDHLDTLNGVEARELKGGALRWGWKDICEDGERLYQVACEVTAGSSLFVITVTCSAPGELSSVAELIGRISVVTNKAHRETVHTQNSGGEA